MQISFDLSIFWAVRERTEEKKGELYVSPGDKFRAEVGHTIWVSDGQTYWQYSKAANQVVIKDLLDVDLSMHPSQMLQNYLNKGSFKLVKEGDELTEFSWESQNSASSESLTLWLDSKKGIIRKIKVVDRNGNISTYTFKKSRIGIDIPNKTFTLTAPEGANVLDTRE
ncbi:MAG: LolA family protein [Chitinispirillaceae bacterium]